MMILLIFIYKKSMNRRKATTMIILHCSATREGQDIKAKTIKQWHKDRGFDDIGYHYVIDLDGTIEKGREEDLVGAHCKGHNATSIGICYVGGCDKNMKPKDTRTPEQKRSMLSLVRKLVNKYKIPVTQIWAHHDFDKHKACPSFDVSEFRKDYIKYVFFTGQTNIDKL